MVLRISIRAVLIEPAAGTTYKDLVESSTAEYNLRHLTDSELKILQYAKSITLSRALGLSELRAQTFVVPVFLFSCQRATKL